MIYLKNLNGAVREYKDHDTSTVDALVGSGRWVRISGRKDWTPFKKATTKKTTKSTKEES